MTSLNTKIVAYLTVNNIAFDSSDYATGQPDGGEDQILYWNADRLGLQPTQAQLDDAYPIWEGQQTAAANKQQAEQLLQATDWVEVPSVSDTANNPHLVNYQEFITYRLALRAIAVNPPTEPAVFPELPQENWSSV